MESIDNIDEVQKRINEIFEDDTCLLNLYAILKVNNEYLIKRVIFDRVLTDNLKNHMKRSIEISNIYNNQTSLMNLSECDERRNVICKLDMEIGGEMSSFVELNNNHGDEYEDLNLKDDLDSLCALVVDIGNSSKQIQIYNHIYPMEILGNNKFIVKIFDNRLTSIESPLILINSSFQAIQLDGNIFITNMRFIEKHAGYHRVIREKANTACRTIESFGCISNIECFKELIDSDISFARKLSKVTKASPVIKKNIPHSEIINFCKNYPSLEGKIAFNADETKIVLTTRVSRDLVLKLFLDDHLTSELTSLHYESHAKDSVDE